MRHLTTIVTLSFLCAGGVLLAAAGAEGFGPVNGQSPKTFEKVSRTPAQQKIDSQLLYEIYRRRGVADEKGVPPPTGLKFDRKGRAYVDIRANVTPALEKKVGRLGAKIHSVEPQYHSVIAWVPVLKLEKLAEDPAVISIVPVAEATTVK